MSGNDLEEEILKSIRRIVRAIEMHSQSTMSQVGLTSPQLSVLKAIGAGAPATPTAIARQLSLSQPTVSGILDRLQAKGYVERTEPGEDRRLHGYRLTASAAEKLAQAPPLLQEGFLRRLGQLQDWERSMLLASLQRVAQLMNADQLEAQPLLTTGSAS